MCCRCCSRTDRATILTCTSESLLLLLLLPLFYSRHNRAKKHALAHNFSFSSDSPSRNMDHFYRSTFLCCCWSWFRFFALFSFFVRFVCGARTSSGRCKYSRRWRLANATASAIVFVCPCSICAVTLRITLSRGRERERERYEVLLANK